MLAKEIGADEAAERLFVRALDLAARQQARSLELRAAMSLARLWGRQRRLTEARSVLHPVFARFTEGFETRDLIEARELLGAVS